MNLKRRLRRTVLFSALAAIVALCLLALPAAFYVRQVKEAVVRTVERALQKNLVLEIEGVRLGLYRGLGFRLYGVSLREKGVERPAEVAAEYLFVGLDVRSLLEGTVRVERLFVSRPRIVLYRDAAGRVGLEGLFSREYVEAHSPEGLRGVPLIETLGPLLWEDRIAVEGAEIRVVDGGSVETPAFWLRDLDMMVRNRIDADTIEFSARAGLTSPVGAERLSVEGEVTGWRQAREARDLQVDLTLSFKGLALAGVGELLRSVAPDDSLEGIAEGRLRYEGSLRGVGRCRLRTEVKRPVWVAPRLHARRYAPRALEVRTAFDLSPTGMRFEHGALDLGDLPLEWSGDVRFGADGLEALDLHLEGRDLDLADVKTYLPLRALGDNPWRFLVEMTRSGQADVEARLRGSAQDFASMETPEGARSFSLRILFKDTRIVLPVQEAYLPFRDVEGELELRDGKLHFRHFSGWYGNTRVVEARGRIDDIHQSASHLSAEGDVVLDMPEAIRELDHGIFPQEVREIARAMSEVRGDGTLDLRIDYDFGSRVEEVLRVGGDVALEGVEARVAGLPWRLRELTGGGSFSDQEVAGIDVRVQVGGSPLHVRGGVGFGGGGTATQGEIHFDTDRLEAEDLMVPLGVDGGLRGVLAGWGKVAWKGDAWQWDAAVRGGMLTWEGTSVSLGIEDLEGRVLGEGSAVDIEQLDLRLQGSTLSCDGRLDSLAPVAGKLRIRSPSLNLDRLLAGRKEKPGGMDRLKRILQPGEVSSPPPGAESVGRLEVDLDCRRMLCGEGRLEDVSARAVLSSDGVVLEQAKAKVKDGRVRVRGEGRFDGPDLPVDLDFVLTQVLEDDLLALASSSVDFLDGAVSLEGRVGFDLRGGEGVAGTLRGRVRLESRDSTIRRYDLAAKILTLINFTQWSKVRTSDLRARGIHCKEIAGDFELERGVLRTDGLTIESSIAVAKIEGDYDFRNDDLDVFLSLRPLETLDEVLDRVPVVGRVLIGDDRTMVIFHYRIEGPLEEPEVRLVPLQGLNDLFSIPFESLERWVERLQRRLQD